MQVCIYVIVASRVHFGFICNTFLFDWVKILIIFVGFFLYYQILSNGGFNQDKGNSSLCVEINVVSTSDAHIRDLNYNTFYGIVFKYRHLNTVFCFLFWFKI